MPSQGEKMSLRIFREDNRRARLEKIQNPVKKQTITPKINTVAPKVDVISDAAFNSFDNKNKTVKKG